MSVVSMQAFGGLHMVLENGRKYLQAWGGQLGVSSVWIRHRKRTVKGGNEEMRRAENSEENRHTLEAIQADGRVIEARPRAKYIAASTVLSPLPSSSSSAFIILSIIITIIMPSATERLPTHQTAIVVNSAGKLHIRPDAPVPGPPSSGTAIIRTAAVAINPVDAKMLDYSPVPGASHGYDFAGTIVALGPDTHDHQLQVGDRVAGFVHGMNKAHPDVGAFAEYVVAPTGLLLRIPPSMRFEDAATIGLGLYTAGLGLFEELRLPFPPHDNSTTTSPSDAHEDNEAPFVLVAGGSTATGTRAIQLLKQ